MLGSLTTENKMVSWFHAEKLFAVVARYMLIAKMPIVLLGIIIILADARQRTVHC